MCQGAIFFSRRVILKAVARADAGAAGEDDGKFSPWCFFCVLKTLPPLGVATSENVALFLNAA